LSQNNGVGAACGTFKSCNMNRSQVSSKHVLAIARYSDSADDLETITCFFDFHEMREFPRKTQNPVTDLLVAWQPPQSESQKAFKERSLDVENNMPCPGVPLMYLRTLNAASQCGFLGSCMN
jgi:hypothetical protein